MTLMITAAFALGALFADPPLSGGGLDRAVRNYQAMTTGQKQLGDLTPQEGSDVIELARWLREHPGAPPPDTREQCKKRLESVTPTPLGEALLELRCSQRPSDGSAP
jgi:hypothetical protein